ncbi:MAG: dipeptide/oligopeptide/nickel ABC transporter ATP-binding protein, partial [Actinobacteria bacterium]|nr:dipeptide/oligopeptide/nickel ABC transporter ATP-binding protein [Actinomycetota bacterium]
MTAPDTATALPVIGTPVLEARSLVKHFPVHRRGRRTRRGA